MTISTTVRTAGPYTGAGTTGPFPFGFKVFQASDLLVTTVDTATQLQSTLALSTDYTATLNADQNSAPGGSITLLSVLPSSKTLSITSNVPITQGLSIPNASGFYPEAIENALDKQTILLQQLGGVATGQTLRVPEANGVPVLPPAASRANTQLLFDAQGNPYVAAPVSGSAADVLLKLINTADQSLGDALLGVKQPFTGAIARTQHDKNIERISVKDFGAVGDGLTDDTAAFVSAIAAMASPVASGAYGWLLIPRGAYKVASTLSVPKGVSIVGDGATASVIQCYDCDGITLANGAWDGNVQVFSDFGLVAMSGTNRTGFRCATSPYLGEQDGFHLHRMQFFDWDTSIYFGSCWQSNVVECWIERTNTGIRLDGHAVLNSIVRCQIMRTGGGRGAAASKGVVFGAVDIEANILKDNFIYGFQRCIELGEPWFCQVTGNTTLATVAGAALVECLTFGTVKEKLILRDNIFEGAPQAGATFTAVWGQPLNSPSGASTTIEGNRFFDDTSVSASSVGLKINDLALTNQGNVHVGDNNFQGFVTNDILVYNGSNITLNNNDCLSTLPTNSVQVRDAVTAPIRVTNNFFAKGMALESAALVDGRIYENANAVGGVWTPVALPSQAWVPADVSGAALTLTVGSAKWSRQGKRCLVQLDVTWPVNASGSMSKVSLPTIPNAAYSGAIGYSTYGTQQTNWVTSGVVATFTVYDAAGNNLTNANLSGKRILATLIYEMA